MRITARIATAGANGLSRFPVPNASIEECLDERGRLDFAKALRALRADQITPASDDDLPVLAFALEYLKQTRSVVERLAAELNRNGVAAGVDDEKGFRVEALTAGDKRCKRRMKKGRYAFCTTDIASRGGGLRVRLSTANPRGVVGGAELFARDYAVMCARILNYLKDSITTARITLVEGEGCEGAFAEARKLDAACDLAKRRASCPNRVSGHCSPIVPTCPCYDAGHCREPPTPPSA